MKDFLCQDLKAHQEKSERKAMKQERQGVASSGHEIIYHAVPRCQAVALSLTSRGSHGLKKACSLEGQQPDVFASKRSVPRSSTDGMEQSGRFKDGRNRGRMGLSHGEEDPRPNGRQGTHCDALAFPFCSFALIGGASPGFLLGTLPSKGMQSIAQGFDTPLTTMWFGGGAALKQDRRRATECLQAGCRLIARGIIANFSEQARSQALPGSGKTAEDDGIFMAQKKVGDLLIICCNL